MDSERAAVIAGRLLEEHGLTGTGWLFGFDTAETRHGSCDFDRRRITLSRPLTAAGTVEQVTQTLLHEVAHALTGPHRGHSAAWRLKARQIGYTGGRTIPTAHRGAQRLHRPRPGLRAGDQVHLPSGRPGILRAVGRTRYHVEDEAGQWWSVAFADIDVHGEPAPASSPPPPSPTETALPIGTRIQVTGGPAKHRGKTGVILAQGPATYRMLCDGGEEQLQVPHRLAALVDAR